MPLIETKGAASAQGFGLTLGGAQPVYIEDVFSTYLYTGNGGTQTITNGIDLAGKGGLTWFKERDLARDHVLEDTVRGAGNALFSNYTLAQASAFGGVQTYNANGFTLNGNASEVNNNANTYVSWTFRKQPKFFDVVTYTGNGANRTISHDLGSVPGCIIIKRTDTTGAWAVYHRSLANTEYLVLNTTAAKATGATYWNSTTPTSTVFSLGTATDVNANTGTYVAYLFAHDAGGFGLSGTDNVISCGSFTANGSGVADVNLGYEPQWILFKPTSLGGSWQLLDTMRGWSVPLSGVPTSAFLYPNTSGAETSLSVADGGLSINATGFGMNANDGNHRDVTFIYIAIRRGPMKVPTSGTSVFGIDTFTGTNSMTTRTGYAFSPDMTISRDQGSASVSNNFVLDRLRGWAGASQATISTNTSSAEVSSSGRPDGTVVSKGIQLYGYSGGNNWFVYFARAPGFFDEVCYTGTGVTGQVINHNLGVTPEMVIIKRRNGTADWFVYQTGLSSGNSIYLNTTAAQQNDGGPAFTLSATAITIDRTYVSTLNTSAGTYVAYLFATVAGVSKVGSYTGTGALQTVNCGFTGGARFVLIKRTDSTGDWYVYDSARGISSGNDPYLLLNSTAAEVTGTNYVDTTSVGFQVTAAAPAGLNANGGSFVFLAIA